MNSALGLVRGEGGFSDTRGVTRVVQPPIAFVCAHSLGAHCTAVYLQAMYHARYIPYFVCALLICCGRCLRPQVETRTHMRISKVDAPPVLVDI